MRRSLQFPMLSRFLPRCLRGVALVLACGLALACHHPLTGGPSNKQLRLLEPFDYRANLTVAPITLEDTPVPPSDGLFNDVEAILAASGDSPGKTVRLTLADVKKYTLENNLGLRVDRLDAEISEQGYVAESWKFEPTLGATVTRTNERDHDDDPKATNAVEATVTIPTRLGGQLQLSLPYTYRNSEQAVARDFLGNPILGGISNAPGLTVSLQQPLLRNAGLSVNYASIDLAGLRARQAEGRLKLATIRLLATAEQRYWSYYAAYENLRIQKSKYDLALNQLHFATRLVEEGVRTNAEVTRAAAGVAREFESVIRAETQRRRSERELKRIINVAALPIESLTAIQPATLPSPMGLTFDRKALIELALEKRMDMLDNELQLAIDKITTDLDRDLALPEVNLDFRYSLLGAEETFNQAMDLVLASEFNSSSVGASVSMPLALNQSARARLRQSRLTLQQTLAHRADLELAVREEVLNAVNAVEQDWQRVLANRHALVLETETYEEEKKQFAAGAVTSSEVLRALSAKAVAEQAFTQANVDYHNSLVDLASATGTILDESGVRWPE